MTASAPTRSAYLTRSIAPAVVIEPTPATTGTRPATAETYSSMTRRCSSGLRLVNSPVVPHGTSPWIPAPTRRSTRVTRAASSTADPSAGNGGGAAGRVPVRGGCVRVMAFLGLGQGSWSRVLVMGLDQGSRSGGADGDVGAGRGLADDGAGEALGSERHEHVRRLAAQHQAAERECGARAEGDALHAVA